MPRADVQDLARQRNLGRTDRRARVAAHTQRPADRQQPRAVVKRRVDESDRARIDVSEHVAANHLVRRTDIGACRAANAPQRVAEVRIGVHRRPAVVDQDDVDLVLRFAPVMKLVYVRDLLRGGGAGEQSQLCGGVGQRRHQLLPTGDHDQQLRQRGDQVAIALVGDEHDLPVSAISALAPIMPASAARNARRSSPRARLTMPPMSWWSRRAGPPPASRSAT